MMRPPGSQTIPTPKQKNNPKNLSFSTRPDLFILGGLYWKYLMLGWWDEDKGPVAVIINSYWTWIFSQCLHAWLYQWIGIVEKIDRKPWILNNRFRDCSKTIEKSAFKKWISVCVRAMTCECSFVTLRYLRLLKSSQVAISQNPARLSHQRSWCGCSPTFQWAAWPLEDLVTWTSFMPCSLKPTKAYNYVHS